MTRRRSGYRRLFRLGGATARDVEAELRAHIEQRVAQLVSEGWSRGAAEAEAVRRLGGDAWMTALLTDASARDERMRWRVWAEAWVQDLRHAVRGLTRDRLIAAFAILVLAVGMGANLAAFDLSERILLRRSAHMAEPERLFRFYGTVESASTGLRTDWWTPWPMYEALAAARGPASPLGAYRASEARLNRGPAARRIQAAEVHGPLFRVLGVVPVRGRLFGPDEERARPGQLAVLSEYLWRTAFAGDPDLLGRSVEIDGRSYEVTGVLPAGFTGPGTQRIDAWLMGDPSRVRNVNWLVIGRLGPGETLERVTAQARTTHGQVVESLPQWYRAATLAAAPAGYGEDGQPPVEATLVRWLGIVTGAILLVAFANIVNLLLVRLSRRRRELAVRMALGSGRARVVRLLALEGGLLALAGGALSLAVASLLEPMLSRALLGEASALTFSILDLRTLGLLALLVLATMLVLSGAPLWQLGRPALIRWLRTTGQGGAAGAPRLRHTLTALQAGFSVVLLVGAGLFLRSIDRVNTADFGIDRERVLTVRTDYVLDVGFEQFVAREMATFAVLQEVARRQPGVAGASIAVGLPLDGGSYGTGLWIPGRDSIPFVSGRGPYVSIVDDTYFATVGTPLRRGRAFSAADRAGSEPVVIINESMAQAVWPGEDPLAKCVHIGGAGAPCARVVGVARDVHRVSLREQSSVQIYQPHGQQNSFAGAKLLVRQTRAGAVSPEELRRTLLEAAPALDDIVVSPITESIGGDLRQLRIGMIMFGLSGALALVVAVLGLYGVMAYLVAARTHEIGVRSAIGASSAQITRVVMGSGLKLAATGVLLGVAAGLVAGRRLEHHLFETNGADPFVFGGVALLLLCAAVTAGWIPVRRALRIDPVQALRSE